MTAPIELAEAVRRLVAVLATRTGLKLMDLLKDQRGFHTADITTSGRLTVVSAPGRRCLGPKEECAQGSRHGVNLDWEWVSQSGTNVAVEQAAPQTT
jgi:hypothetical protein